MATQSLTLNPEDNDATLVEVDVSRVDGPTTAFLHIGEDGHSAAAWLTATETRAVIAALQATLPAENTHTVVSAAELDALPLGAQVTDSEGDVWTKRWTGWGIFVSPSNVEAAQLARYLPGTLRNPEILDTDDGLAEWERALLGGDELAPAAEKSTTAGTLRVDLRLFLGDRDITYALADPIADALEG